MSKWLWFALAQRILSLVFFGFAAFYCWLHQYDHATFDLLLAYVVRESAKEDEAATGFATSRRFS